MPADVRRYFDRQDFGHSPRRYIRADRKRYNRQLVRQERDTDSLDETTIEISRLAALK